MFSTFMIIYLFIKINDFVIGEKLSHGMENLVYCIMLLLYQTGLKLMVLIWRFLQ
ncbi:hypothetical protein Patl1_16488 [Pistacia atlantica]|uniref:Uncharacterized protein n=1 Tax=Pistacia atlantica TaxID=434234 RepID=A0ACC1B7R8_9ROSI|nr:hypothetical protein Patl1_16488 [Pistacia atlantica]